MGEKGKEGHFQKHGREGVDMDVGGWAIEDGPYVDGWGFRHWGGVGEQHQDGNGWGQPQGGGEVEQNGGGPKLRIFMGKFRFRKWKFARHFNF